MEAGTGTTARRPLGITILAVLGILSGGFGILSSLLLLAGGAVLGASGDAGTGGMAMILGVLLLVVSVLQLAFGIGACLYTYSQALA